VTAELELWAEANKRHLLASIAQVRVALERYGGREASEPPPAELDEPHVPFALERAESAFGLSSFERDVLLLCAGVELDAGFAALCRELDAAPPTFSLALAALPDPHWSAIAPRGPLRHWILVDAVAGAVATSPIRIDERVLHFLTGIGYLDDRLADAVAYVPAGDALPPSQRAAAARIAALWASASEPPVVGLSGRDAHAKRVVAAAACAEHELVLHVLRAADAPQTQDDRARFARLWEREAILLGSALLLEIDEDDGAESLLSTEGSGGYARPRVVIP